MVPAIASLLLLQSLIVAIGIANPAAGEGSPLQDPAGRSSRELAGTGSVFELSSSSFAPFNVELAELTLVLCDTQDSDANWHLTSAFMNAAKDLARKSNFVTFAFVNAGTEDGRGIMGAYEQKSAGEELSYPALLAIVPPPMFTADRETASPAGPQHPARRRLARRLHGCYWRRPFG